MLLEVDRCAEAVGRGARLETSDAGSCPTDVAITFDIEFTIGGAFTFPGRKEPAGECSVRCFTKGEESGLGFILACLKDHGLKATFFVEVLQTAYFGDRPMGRIVERIARAGHDIQLHLHPCWLYFSHSDWIERLRIERPNDSCAGRSIEVVRHFIEHGLDTFARWGISRPIALRTGSLAIDRTVYAAMSEYNIPISSSIGLGYATPSDASLRLENGRHVIDGIVELPVTSFTAFGLRGWQFRLLSPPSTSRREAIELCKRARNAGVTPVVLLAHAHDFIKGRPHELVNAMPNWVVKRRFSEFCQTVASRPYDFRSVTFEGYAKEWKYSNLTSTLPASLTLPPLMSLSRIAANIINSIKYV